MTWDLTCSDGVRRHGGPFATRRQALHASTWAWCYLGHRIIESENATREGSPTKVGGTGIRDRAAVLSARRDQLEGTPAQSRPAGTENAHSYLAPGGATIPTSYRTAIRDLRAARDAHECDVKGNSQHDVNARAARQDLGVMV